jgi:uncharacterized protein
MSEPGFIASGARVTKLLQEVCLREYSGYFAGPQNDQWDVAYNPFMPFHAYGHIQLP